MSLLETLTEQGRIWTARHWQQTVIPAVSSQYAKLDEYLPGHGWPIGAITEVLFCSTGQGELRLLLPALAQLSQQDDRWQLWLNPPFIPCAPSLTNWGFNTQRVILAQTHNANDSCHCLEKSLQTNGCQAVVAWLGKFDKALMRRLQLAAESAHVPVFLLRSSKFEHQPSVAALRLLMGEHGRIDILKRRAGWPVSNIELNLPLHGNKGN
ncbi:translesion DNA synthesis-associated protein ImuA [Reinekea marinisedimentorum]|uniref:Protein ImuA n=1 Tax=Reinekea marinisedimentorum TaxID=230495 RepID=A0A4R3I054_9GAMM|nr:translesion DNA synthesis-associated protein ImuA [Reinekea marinisedimentorum]TCS38898.1 protein ImuA [Reinekea marinisedimentorum]